MFIEVQDAGVVCFSAAPAAKRAWRASQPGPLKNKIDLWGVGFYKHGTLTGFQSGRAPKHASRKNQMRALMAAHFAFACLCYMASFLCRAWNVFGDIWFWAFWP